MVFDLWTNIDLVNLLINLNNGYFCVTHEHNNNKISCSITFLDDSTLLKYMYELYQYFSDNDIQDVDNNYQDDCFHISYFDEQNNCDIQKTFYGMNEEKFRDIKNKVGDIHSNLDEYTLDLMFSNYYT